MTAGTDDLVHIEQTTTTSFIWSLATAMTARATRCSFLGRWFSSARSGTVTPVELAPVTGTPLPVDIPSVEYYEDGSVSQISVVHTIANAEFSDDGSIRAISPQLMGVFFRVIVALEYPDKNMVRLYGSFFKKRDAAKKATTAIHLPTTPKTACKTGCQSLHHAPNNNCRDFDPRALRRTCPSCYLIERRIHRASWIPVSQSTDRHC
jgi:hypothetical protein